MRNSKGFTFDVNLRLKDAGAIAASARAQIGGVDCIRDMGPARFDARVIVDVIACEVDTGNELYTLIVQGSNTPNFSSTVVGLAAIRLGHSSTTLDSASSGAGRREIAFTNEVNGVIYQYVSMYTVVGGTIASGGVNYVANMVLGA